MRAIQRWWAKSVLNKITLLLSFSLVFCCCGWTGRVGNELLDETASAMPQSIQAREHSTYLEAGR